MTTDPFNLQRFVDAQNGVIDEVYEELRSGYKQCPSLGLARKVITSRPEREKDWGFAVFILQQLCGLRFRSR